MTPKTIEILPHTLMTTQEVAKAIKKNDRTVQELGKAQLIKSTIESLPRGGKQRLYDPESVAAYIRNPVTLQRKHTKKTALASTPSTAVALTTQKPPLETMNVFLSVLEKAQKANDALLSQMESLAKIHADSLQGVVAQFFAAQKADREDALHRFNAERKDRQERLQLRRLPIAPAKFHKAHA